MKLLGTWRTTSILLLSIGLGACALDRAGLGWTVSVQPVNVCPGEWVTLSWDTGETRERCLETCSESGCLDCRDPIQVSVSSEPRVLEDFSTFVQSSSRSAGPIFADTTFHFSARDDDDVMQPYDRSVHVVLPVVETYVSAVFEGSCFGDAPSWQPVSLAAGEFRSALVRMVHVCNRSDFTIRLRLTFDLGFETYILMGHTCTPDFPADMGFSVLGASITSVDLRLTRAVECTTRGIAAPDILVDVLLICDREGTSAAVVAATPEDTEEPDLIDVPTLTPEPTYTSEPAIPLVRFIQNANCRSGPGVIYDVVTSLLQDQELTIEGRDPQNNWWWVLLPESAAHCWVSDTTVEVTGPASEVQVIAAPPTPVQGCLHQGPNDNQPICYEPCPPNPNPGGACIP